MYQNVLQGAQKPLTRKFDKKNNHTIPTIQFFLGHFQNLKKVRHLRTL